MKGNDGARLNVKELYPLDGYVANNIPGHVAAVARAPELPDFLPPTPRNDQRSGGDTRVELAFVFEDRAGRPEAPASLNWRVVPAAFATLRAHPAVAGLLAEARRPELKEVKRWGRKG